VRSQVDHRPVSGEMCRAELPGGNQFRRVRYPARCAEPNCQAEINSGERAFYYPGDKAVYGTRWGHGEKAERDFNAHRIDEDGF